jgi:putative PIN family toxin of toxin-antitoxin system
MSAKKKTKTKEPPLVVLDANTWVSGMGWPNGPAGKVVDLVMDGTVVPVTSPPLLNELERVLKSKKLAKVFPDPRAVIREIETLSEVVVPSSTVKKATHTADDRVLEAAQESKADFLITRDGDLLNLGTFETRTQIVTPEKFLEILAEAEGEDASGDKDAKR